MYIVIREDLSKLPYTTMCIKETLRMYPLTPIISRVSSEEIVTDGYKLPKGMSNMYRAPSIVGRYCIRQNI